MKKGKLLNGNLVALTEDNMWVIRCHKLFYMGKEVRNRQPNIPYDTKMCTPDCDQLTIDSNIATRACAAMDSIELQEVS